MGSLQCRFCGEPISKSVHKNRRYCNNNQCYTLSANARSSKKYAKEQSQLVQFRLTEKTLDISFRMFENKYVEASLLDKLGMNWTLYHSIKTIDGYEAKVIGNYAYTLFKNGNLRIWKI